LTDLDCFNAPISDAICPVLQAFPRLKGISFVPGTFTGRGFPLLRNLEIADFSFCPVSAEGLSSIAKAPKLTSIHLNHHPSPSASLLATANELRARRPGLEILGLDSDE
jgi:hypothetical protein